MEKSRQWVILTAVGAVAILVAGWFLVASPQHKHAASLRAQASSLTASNQQLQVRVHQRQAMQAGVAVEQRKLDKIAQQIPDNPALPTLIRQLSAAAKAAGVDLVSLAPSAPVVAAAGATTAPSGATSLSATHAAATSSLVQIPVAVQVTGSYFNVEAFFNAIEKMTRVMKVPTWSMTPFTGTTGAPSTGSTAAAPTQALPGTVTTTITGVIYELPTVAVAPATAPVAAGGSTTGSTAGKPATGTTGTTGTSSSTGGTSSSSTSSSSTSSNGQ